MENIAISVKDLDKVYKLYEKPMDRLKDSLGLTRKQLYKEHYALKKVNMDIRRGETVGIIGTNGSGKSTILKIITGVLNPTAGSVQVDGRISALLELGAGFNMEYTGIENIYLNGTMIGFTEEEIEAKMQDILDFADIGDFVYQPVKTYSSGMFVRLAFAVAINIEPEILIVDEALSVGDVFFQAKCYRKFEEFKQMGKTILFVSHDLSSISKYCDRVVLLNKGVKLAEGAPKEMINRYKKLLVHADETDLLDEDASGASETNAISRADKAKASSAFWKDSMNVNEGATVYGNGMASVVDFGIFDEEELLTSSIEKGTVFTVRSKVTFAEDIADPIFTFTIKNLKGTDVTGTNTMFEKVPLALAKAGETYIASFRQRMQLQGGEYLVSIGCTGYRNGEFTAYNRLYDICSLTVISDKNTVGFFDMESEVTVERENGNSIE